MRSRAFVAFEIGFFLFCFLLYVDFQLDLAILSDSQLLLASNLTVLVLLPFAILGTILSFRRLRLAGLVAIWLGLTIRVHEVPMAYNFAYPPINLICLSIGLRILNWDPKFLGNILNVTLSVGYLFSAWTKWMDSSWSGGEALTAILSTAHTVYPHVAKFAANSETEGFLSLMTYAIIGVQGTFWLSNFGRRPYFICHGIMIAFHVISLMLLNVTPVSIAYLFVHIYILMTIPLERTDSILRDLMAFCRRKSVTD